MNDDIQMVPIDDLNFIKRTETLPADLIDRITLIHHVFRDYWSPTLEETIDNFKYDQNPEDEIRVWEHMASVMITLKYQSSWPEEKLKLAVNVVLGLSTGAIQNNQLGEEDTGHIADIWINRSPR